MWECQCGCKGIAADLAACPMCEKEREMPKATSAGASNAWEPQDEPMAAEAAAPVEAAPVQADTAPVTAEPVSAVKAPKAAKKADAPTQGAADPAPAAKTAPEA